MAVPKKRTSKAKKNKRKTAWKQKSFKVTLRSQSLVIYAETFPTKNVIGFQPELRFKSQPADQLRSKREHFMTDEVKAKLEANAKKRSEFKPQANNIQEEINARFEYNFESQSAKEARIKYKQNKKANDKEKERLERENESKSN